MCRISTLSVFLVGMAAQAAVAQGPCGSWEQVATPNPGLERNGFIDADADGGPVFALLRSTDQPGSAAPATYHMLRRDTGGWTDLGEPDRNAGPGIPVWLASAAAPDGRVWVGGKMQPDPFALSEPAVSVLDPDTGVWSTPENIPLMAQTGDPFADRGGTITAMDAAPDGTLFAVGNATGFGGAGDVTVPMFLMNDGGGWIEVADPAFDWPGGGVGAGIAMNDVLALAPDDVWAVGRHPAGDGIGAGGLLIHWDGSSLSLVEDPRVGGVLFIDRELGGIDATGPDDIWAVGDGSAAGGPTVTLAHFDGSDWTLAPSPYPTVDALDHVVMASDGSTWTTGVFADAQEAYMDGSGWTLQPFAPVPQTRIQAMARDADGVLWAFGDVAPADSYAQSLDCTSPHCPADLNGDGVLDLNDIQAFVDGFLTQDPIADLNGDGVLDLTDVNLFVTAFLNGCT
ncbi:MAG TPA: hypothetical protein ENK11_08240 [Phycisphaerales bacterium]|nr:hypothetical protein [Phycisphaerales bacterium]